MNKVAQISEYEEDELRDLYVLANEANTRENIQAIQDFYKSLGKKYKFDHTKASINTRGEVFIYDFNKKYKVTISYEEDGEKATVMQLAIRPFDVRRVKEFLKELEKDIG